MTTLATQNNPLARLETGANLVGTAQLSGHGGSQQQQNRMDTTWMPLSSPTCSAYNLFFQEERLKIMAAQGTGEKKGVFRKIKRETDLLAIGRKLSFQELATTIGQRWKLLPDTEKERYSRLEREDAERHQKAMSDPSASHQSIVSPPPPSGAAVFGHLQSHAPCPSTARAAIGTNGNMDNTQLICTEASHGDSSNDKKRSAGDVVDLLEDDSDVDEDDDRKMPATKKPRTSGDDMDPVDAAIVLAQEMEERKQKEQNAMYLSNAGRAFKFVEAVIQMHRQLLPDDANSQDIALVGQDDMVFLAERFLICQQNFASANKPTHVSLAYHYTSEQHLQSIRQDGLLSHPERRSSNIRTKRGAYFGDGVYTACNPYGFRHFGDTGLLCAIVKGQEARVGPGGTQDPNLNTAIGNKSVTTNPLTDEIILRECCQVLPIIRYSQHIIHPSGSREYNGNEWLWQFHEKVQSVLDEFFNRGAETIMERVIPSSVNTNQVQKNSFSSVANLAPLPINTIPNPGWASSFGSAFIATSQTQSQWQNGTQLPQQQRATASNFASGLFPTPVATTTGVASAPATNANPFTSPSFTQQALNPGPHSWPQPQPISTQPASMGASFPFMGVPQQAPGTSVFQTLTPSAPNPPVPNESLTYVAPASLVSANDCCRRVRTLSRSEDCSICFTKLHRKGRVLQLYSCCHLFHSECISAALKHDSKCPTCRVPVSKEPQGRSPSGTMTISHTPSQCGGFAADSNGSITTRYVFPSGTQLPYHETPGQTYSANRRTAYLPNNKAGRNLLKRFKFAWSKGLLFGVGTSLTTGRSDQVVWASVHQKSSLNGGVNGHGFPDPNYFRNVNAELDALGVPSHEQIKN